MSESGEQFLHRRDPKLHTTTPVEHESARKKRTGEQVSQNPADKITDFLRVIERTHMGHKDDPRVAERIKGSYYKDYVIKPENIPQSYWNLQGDIAVSEGRKQDLISGGVVIDEATALDQNGNQIQKRSYTFPEDLKEQAVRNVISNQQQSLGKWIDYLTSDDATYPMWAKYWVFRSIVKMGELEKTEDGKARFANRDKYTVSSFPVLNQRALAQTIGAMTARLEERNKPKIEQKPVENLSTILSDADFQQLLSTEDFSRLYAQFLAEIPQYSTRGLGETRGRWIKYNQGSDPKQLVASLEGHPLEWCTADYDTAKTQLQGGDFYVYYSIDEEGKPIIPRLAIRMEGSRIAEPPRGIAPKQNLDPYISDVLENKLTEFGPEGQAFKKRAEDMKRLTVLEQKVQVKHNLDVSDLVFLYEINAKIEGFGYEPDVRITELRSKRNPEEDMPVVFGCDRNQIARSINDVRSDTKVYVGKPVLALFDLLQQSKIEYIYTSFPEGRIRKEKNGIGGKKANQLEKELGQAGINWSGAKDILRSPDFTTLETPEVIETIRLRVQDLGFDGIATTAQIFGTKDDVDEHGKPAPFTKGRMTELGLEFCPPEVGVYQRLKDTNQPLGEWYYIVMKPIADSDVYPHVFLLERRGDGLWLRDFWVLPDNRWGPGHEFVFSLRTPAGEAGKFES